MISYINFGGADGITGACHMISTEDGNVLLDCGLFQGRDKRIYSNVEMYFDPKNIEAVVLSHAHIDHCGRIPVLYQMGYRGKVYGTRATKLLAEIVLKESFKSFNEFSQESYLEFNDSYIDMFLDNYVEINYKEPIEVFKDFYVELFDAGHLLGSASIVIKYKDKTIFYSGDIGKSNTPILKEPQKVLGADYAIIESTYGDIEKHESNDFYDKFEDVILNTLKRGGRCVIPSSTVGKMQEILYLINGIFEEKDLKYKVYIDSPMSSKIIQIYEEFRELYDEDAKKRLKKGDDPLHFKNLTYITTKEESIELQEKEEPYIVLSAGGMCEGGRVVYHLRKQISNECNSIILVGYQAKGTLGYRLSSGAKEVKIFRDKFSVKADIYNFPSLSGHADRESIIEYINLMKEKPKKVFLVHGNRDSQIELRKSLNFDDVEYTKFLKRYNL